jgi:predicted PurR-regulated permease PerM
LGGGSRWRDFLGDGDDRLVDHPWRRQCTRLGADPTALILIATGEVWRGIGLAVFCALVVGSVDNVLRPRLVGQDIKMHELLIFFSTLGGLLLFGAMGFIVGPILAALFVTVWEMFGTAFRSSLAEPGSAATGSNYLPPA